MTPHASIDAGDFDAWLQAMLASFKSGRGIDVPCGDCRGCCSAGRFIHVLPSDRNTCLAIPKQLLLRAPGMPDGRAVMGYLDDGACPMLKAGNCSIYSSRPATCRAFDCRVLAAAGLSVEGKWAERINARAHAWRFTYATSAARRRHEAIRDTAFFIRRHADAFPAGRIPTQPGDLAVLAIKVHPVLLDRHAGMGPADIAAAIVAKGRAYEEAA